MPLSWQKYRLLRTRSSSFPSQDDISLSKIGIAPPLPNEVLDENDGNRRRVRNSWYFLCYALHGFLVLLHIVLLGIAESNHAERRIIIQNDLENFTLGLSGGLQAFYTLYTALLVFVTQKLMLSTLFSRPKKLTEIHDIHGAWAGFGASLGTLWQQTKVTSSILSITLVTLYFACISALHVTSSTLMKFQVFNNTMSVTAPVIASWPDASVDLASLDGMVVDTIVPFLQSLYGNTTNGLMNNTLYDIYNVSTPGFINTTVNATTLNAHCGLLTNLSVDYLGDTTWNVTVSMPDLDTFNITIAFPPLLNEIWFPPLIKCSDPICSTYPLYLVSSALDVDDSVDGVDSVYINGTYYPLGGTPQNFSSPIYIVACSMNATYQTTVLDLSGIQLNSSVQPTNATWSAFSPDGDLNLTTAISSVMTSGDSLPSSPYCQPVMSYPQFWANITAFNAYMRLLLGMPLASCSATSFTDYTVPSLLTRDQVESAVSLIAAQSIWSAGELGAAGGGFDRQVESGQILEYVTEWRLNINIWPAILSLGASVILLVLVVYVFWKRWSVLVADAGVLEIMWFGSRSRVLRGHLQRGADTPSLDNLRASSMFETIFWTQLAMGHEEGSTPPLHDGASDTGSSRPLLASMSVASGNSHPSILSRPGSVNMSSSRRWCYALQIVFVALHAVLLFLLISHPEQSVVIADTNGTLTIGLSAFLQAIYTLYSTVVVFLMQRLVLFKLVRQRRKLTAVHNVSAAWTGIGAAIYTLWRQRKVSSSIKETIAAGAYLGFMLVLHITSSSIMQWQAFDGTLLGAIETNLAMPDNAVNISLLGWTEIYPIAHAVNQDSRLSTYGLSNNTLYDVAQDPTNIPFTMASVNATTVKAQCGLVPNLTVSYNTSSPEMSTIDFQSGVNNGSFFVNPFAESDSVHFDEPTSLCPDCPQTLFYMMSIAMNVGESIPDSVAVAVNFTYVSGGDQNGTMLIYIAACSLSTQTVLAPLDIQQSQLVETFDLNASSTSWSLWVPGNATNFSVEILQPILVDSLDPTNSFLASFLGLSLSGTYTEPGTNSSAILSSSQLENAIEFTAAKYLWLAGQLGKSGGGFDRSVGESPATSDILQYRLHLNTAPVVLASIASFLSLVLATIIIGRGSPREHSASIYGTSVLECLWLEAHSETLHSCLQAIEEPSRDKLRAAGMFDICLGEVGQQGYSEGERPILEHADG